MTLVKSRIVALFLAALVAATVAFGASSTTVMIDDAHALTYVGHPPPEIVGD